MLTAVLREAGFSVRGDCENHHSRFSVPLSILGLQSGRKNPLKWLYVFCAGLFKTLLIMPRYVVLEVDVGVPGTIPKTVTWLRPDISVLTRLPYNPMHLELFTNREELYSEKMALLWATKQGGTVIYNDRDTVQESYVRTLPNGIIVRSFTNSGVQLCCDGIHYDETGNPIGIDAVVTVDGREESFYIPDTLGIGAIESLLIVITITHFISETIPIQVIRRAIASKMPMRGRMHILQGVNGSIVIDDTRGTAPIALEEALRVLGAINKRKKIVVLSATENMPEKQKAVNVTDTVLVVDGNIEDVAAQCITLADDETVFLCSGILPNIYEEDAAG